MKVSVIVPVYNIEKYLSKCVESVLGQTYGNFELILVDDGSTDSSGNICDCFSEQDKRIIVIHKKNGGLSSARNAGLDIAKGEYVIFVDGDDYVDSKMIETLLKASMDYDVNLVMCNYVHVDEKGNQVGISELRIEKPELLSSDEMLDRVSKGWTFGVIAWNKIYRRELFNSIRYPVGKISEDEFISHRIMATTKKAVIIPTVLYYYTLREGSITKSGFTIKQTDSFYALLDRVDFMNSIGKEENASYSLFLAIKKLSRNWKHRNDSVDISKIFNDFRAQLLDRCKTANSQNIEFRYKAAIWLFGHSFPVLRLILFVYSLHE